MNKSKSSNFDNHLKRKNGAEDEVADLHHLGECLWLVMILNGHAEGVHKDTEKNELLEKIVVNDKIQASSKTDEGMTNSFPT